MFNLFLLLLLAVPQQYPKYNSESMELYMKARDLCDYNNPQYLSADGTPYDEKYYFMAIDSLTKAINIDSTFINAYFFRGAIKLKVGDYKGAINDFESKAQLYNGINPRNIQNVYEKSSIEDKINFFPTALINLYFGGGAVISLERYYYLKGKAYLKNNQIQQALKYFNDAIKADSNDPFAYYGKGCALTLSNKYTEALSSLKKAVELAENDDSDNYDSKRLKIQIGQVYYCLGDLNKAMFYVNECIGDYDHIDTTYISCHDSEERKDMASNYKLKANIYYKKIDYVKAVKFYIISLAYYKKDGEVYYKMGLSYNALKNRQKAIDSMKKAESMGYPDAKKWLTANK